jgi:flagellar motor switch/type III secretory pathway protein FliN
MSSSPISSSSTERALAQTLDDGDPLAAMFDVRCNVDVIIGTAVLTLRECLTLRRDHVVKLNEPAGSDLSVRVHGVTLASGEVVVIEDAAALRVTRVLAPAGVED